MGHALAVLRGGIIVKAYGDVGGGTRGSWTRSLYPTGVLVDDTQPRSFQAAPARCPRQL